MTRATILSLRALLVVLLLGTVVAQLWFFPVLAGGLAHENPELAWLRWPLLVVVIVVIVLAQAVLIAIWRLLSLVERDRVFSPDAFGWVSVIIGSAAGGCVLVLGTDAYLTLVVEANPPALMLMLAAVGTGLGAFALLMAVMKGLLRQAAGMKHELSEVI